MSADQKSAYAEAGVDIDAQDKALGKVKKLVRSTFTDGVLSELGSFGGLFRPTLDGLAEPVLVASADGVGTKLMVARTAGDFSTVGQDLVNHCVNDILVQGGAQSGGGSGVRGGCRLPGERLRIAWWGDGRDARLLRCRRLRTGGFHSRFG